MVKVLSFSRQAVLHTIVMIMDHVMRWVIHPNSKLSYSFAVKGQFFSFDLNWGDNSNLHWDIGFFFQISTVCELILLLCYCITAITMHLVPFMRFLYLLVYPNEIYFILGYSSCTNWEEPQGWRPSKSRKCGPGIRWLCSKIGRTLYILYRIQIIKMARNLLNMSFLCCYAFYLMATLDLFHKAERGAHNYYLEKGSVDSRPDHILNLIHYEVRTPFHL